MKTASKPSSPPWVPGGRYDRLAGDGADLFENYDPLGFEAGDANLYRYVGNSPTNATDASGLQEKKVEPVSKTPQSDARVYGDEIIYRGGPFKRIASYKNAINHLIELRDEAKKEGSLVTLNVYYVAGLEGMAKFAAGAVAKAGDKSVNYFYGHGTGGATVDKDTLTAVKKAFAGLKEGDTRTFGVNGCFPGPYNGAIPEKNRLIKWKYPRLVAGKEDGTISEADALTRFFQDIEEIYKAAKASLEKKEKVEINLYFGDEGDREKLIKDYPELKDTTYRFANWTKK